MHWLMYFAIGWWIGGARKRRIAREKTSGEINATLETGMPSPDSAVGKKAKAVAEAQAQKLADPPPVHGSARWATADDASAVLDAVTRHTSRGARVSSGSGNSGARMTAGRDRRSLPPIRAIS